MEDARGNVNETDEGVTDEKIERDACRPGRNKK